MADSKAASPHANRLAMAEAAVSAMKDGYKEQLQADAKQLSSIWKAIDPANPGVERMDALFDIAHNLKGQAGTFGYDLVTSVADSLCELLLNEGARSEKMKAVGQHVSALNRIVDNGISGSGGEVGAKILQALQTLSEKR